MIKYDCSFKSPPLVILSMDGFRASYLTQNITPALQRIIDCGVHSKYLIPSFPSKTFPNHYAIATGLYPAWNGIVDNGFYDPNLPEVLDLIFHNVIIFKKVGVIR